MKIYVDEIPESCGECILTGYCESNMNLRNKKRLWECIALSTKHEYCPLQLLPKCKCKNGEEK